MKLTHSYKVKIINVNDCLNDTILIYGYVSPLRDKYCIKRTTP